MIPEREREALMRLTMCAREECGMCKYKDTCDFDFQYETATRCMNILADALRKTENSSEKPNNCGTCKHWEYDAKYKWWHCPLQDNGMYECRYEPKDEPQTDCDTCKHNGVKHAYDYACDKCTDMDKWECDAEPQTDCPRK